MPRIAIVTDTGADLTPEELHEYDITALPQIFRFGQDVYEDGQLTSQEFWHRALDLHEVPATSAPPAGLFVDEFRRRLALGFEHILCPVLTGKHSGTFTQCSIAAQDFPGQVTIFDSQSVSLGFGFQVLAAARALRAGQGLAETLAVMADMRARTHVFILLDTLEFLRRGGRADRIMPMLDGLARVLSIKVLIQVGPEGEIKPLGAVRTREKGVARLVDEVAQRTPASVPHGGAEAVAAVHTRSPEEAQRLADRLAERTGLPRANIPVREVGAVLATHAGPGALGAVVVQQ